MILSLLFFMDRFDNLDARNKTNSLLKDLYELDEGIYSLKDGILYQNDYKVSNKTYVKADGDINIDKYNNVRLSLSYKDRCIFKTYMGKIEIEKRVCDGFKDIDVTINRNNNKISFVSDVKNLDYKLSSSDDFKGEWISEDYKDNIVLRKYNEGKNYIWFKDSEGNLSNVYEFEVECFRSTKSKYDNSVFYCSGSTVKVDNIDFVVVKDTNISTTLMKYLPDIKINQCYSSNNIYCYYEKNDKNTYNWENSYINYYLNNEFLSKLSSKTRELLDDSEICIDEDSVCDDESCIGRTKEEIVSNEYICNKYTSSKLRLITYDEFNYVYGRASNKDVLNGNYWALNSFYKDYGSSIQYNLDFYVYENLTNELDIKPVIVLRK